MIKDTEEIPFPNISVYPTIDLEPKLSFELECITPDKQEHIQKVMNMSPIFNTNIYKIWENLRLENYLVINKITGRLYIIDGCEIKTCMDDIWENYPKLTVELFDIFIQLNFSIKDTINEMKLRLVINTTSKIKLNY